MARNTLAVLAALTSLALAAPAAADPFEVSKQRCIESGKMESSCITMPSANLTIGAFMEEIGYTIERVRELNGWGEEVTPETVVPAGGTFAFG